MFPRHENVKAVTERHPAMLWENPTDSCLPYQNRTAHNPQTRRGRKGTRRPPPERLGQLTPIPNPHPPEVTPVPPGNNEAAHLSKIKGVPPGYVYLPTPLPSAQVFNLDAYAKGSKHDKDFHPDLLTDERNIHWVVHYLLRSNAADIHFADDSSQLRELDSEDEHWSNGTEFLSVLLSTISGHFKVYFKRYIYMYY